MADATKARQEIPWLTVLGQASIPVALTLSVAVGLVFFPFDFVAGIQRDFYVVTAEVIPVILIAVLIRHAWNGDVLVDVKTEIGKTFARSMTQKQRLDEIVQNRLRSGESMEDLGELTDALTEVEESLNGLESRWRSLAGVTVGTALATLLLATWGEASALVALAFGFSTAWTLVPAVLALIWMSGNLLLGEIRRFEERLFPLDWGIRHAEEGLTSTNS
jgi:hypothetical protein